MEASAAAYTDGLPAKTSGGYEIFHRIVGDIHALLGRCTRLPHDLFVGPFVGFPVFLAPFVRQNHWRKERLELQGLDLPLLHDEWAIADQGQVKPAEPFLKHVPSIRIE